MDLNERFQFLNNLIRNKQLRLPYQVEKKKLNIQTNFILMSYKK